MSINSVNQVSICFACGGAHYPSDVRRKTYFSEGRDYYVHKELPDSVFRDRLAAHKAACEHRQAKRKTPVAPLQVGGVKCSAK